MMDKKGPGSRTGMDQTEQRGRKEQCQEQKRPKGSRAGLITIFLLAHTIRGISGIPFIGFRKPAIFPHQIV